MWCLFIKSWSSSHNTALMPGLKPVQGQLAAAQHVTQGVESKTQKYENI